MMKVGERYLYLCPDKNCWCYFIVEVVGDFQQKIIEDTHNKYTINHIYSFPINNNPLWKLLKNQNAPNESSH